MKNKMLSKIGALTMMGMVVLGGANVYASEARETSESTAAKITGPVRIVNRMITDHGNFENLEDWQRAELEVLFEEANSLRNTLLERQKEYGILSIRAKFADIEHDGDFTEVLTHTKEVIGEIADEVLISRGDHVISFEEIARRAEVLDVRELKAEAMTFVGDTITAWESEPSTRFASRAVEVEPLKGVLSVAAELIKSEGGEFQALHNITEEQMAEIHELQQRLSDVGIEIFEKKIEFGLVEINEERIDVINRAENVLIRTLVRN